MEDDAVKLGMAQEADAAFDDLKDGGDFFRGGGVQIQPGAIRGFDDAGEPGGRIPLPELLIPYVKFFRNKTDREGDLQ